MLLKMCLFTKNIAVLEAQISSLKKEEFGPPLEEKEENSDWLKGEEEYRGNRGGVRGLLLLQQSFFAPRVGGTVG